LGSILCALLLTAVATSITGPIASVAFLSGPIASRIVGKGRSNLLASALVGVVLILASELVGQNLFAVRYPVGVITGILGAPYLLLLLLQINKKGERV
jgi:iron complex transport system permease protein